MIDNVKKYFIPLNDIPFDKIPSLERISYKYVECKEIRIDDLFTHGASIITVFEEFHLDKMESFSNNTNILFGPLLSQHLSTRGSVKCILKDKSTIQISPDNLPDLKYVTSSGKYFVTKNGKYAAMYGSEIEIEKVAHLEGIHIYGDWLLKLRVVIELLKRNVKNGNVNLELESYKEIAHLVLRNEPALSKCDESVFNDAVNNWIPSMLAMPLINDIPEGFIGKVIN